MYLYFGHAMSEGLTGRLVIASNACGPWLSALPNVRQILLFGILAAVCLTSGYIPIPFELVKRRGRIVGISLLFLLIDFAGAFFSLMSLGDLTSL